MRTDAFATEFPYTLASADGEDFQAAIAACSTITDKITIVTAHQHKGCQGQLARTFVAVEKLGLARDVFAE
jgi:hypothetical protein